MANWNGHHGPSCTEPLRTSVAMSAVFALAAVLSFTFNPPGGPRRFSQRVSVCAPVSLSEAEKDSAPLPEAKEPGVPLTLPKTGKLVTAQEATDVARFRTPVVSSALFTALAVFLVALKTGALNGLKTTVTGALSYPLGSLRKCRDSLLLVRKVFRLAARAQAQTSPRFLLDCSDQEFADELLKAASADTHPSDVPPSEQSPPPSVSRPTSMHATMSPPCSAPSDMRASEIKAELASLGVGYSGVFDRAELEALLSRSREEAPHPGARPGPEEEAQEMPHLSDEEIREQLKGMEGMCTRWAALLPAAH